MIKILIAGALGVVLLYAAQAVTGSTPCGGTMTEAAQLEVQP